MPALPTDYRGLVLLKHPHIVLFRNTVSEHDTILSHLQHVRKIVEADDLRNSPQSADGNVSRNHRKKYVAHHKGDESLPIDRRCAVPRYVSYVRTRIYKLLECSYHHRFKFCPHGSCLEDDCLHYCICLDNRLFFPPHVQRFEASRCLQPVEEPQARYNQRMHSQANLFVRSCLAPSVIS
ncbi:hypothetical protein TNIN_3451 [Trichonephila inaurata madagascariensis]|uniref:Uncharacterized protein n=1 Tax=Trichonephila inaurata madagascariensis TaxID=2747483 RepID=A0A8X7BWX9_9ARAC|nr:hypothetical protein TNIN_3451 [Trichonephila inaurata madagascariensis]